MVGPGDSSRILSEHLAGATFDGLPPEAVRAAKRSLLDAVGVMLAASGLADECRPFLQLAASEGGEGSCSVIGSPARVSAQQAAFANGSLAHALDFEDTHDEAFVHPNAAVVPAALAVAEARGAVGGREFLAALALGSDLVCRLGLALEQDPIQHGWYMPPILGAFGATAAAGRLLGLTPLQLTDAFSLTLCQATCSAEVATGPRSVVRAVRDAFAARAGVLSAQLAAVGTTGSEQPFEADFGFFRLYARDAYDLEAFTGDLGFRCEGARVSYKPWPSCRGTHGPIEAALEIRQRHGPSPADITAIRITTGDSPLVRALLEPAQTKQAPENAIQAKFSVPFTVGLALARGSVSLDHFSGESLRDPEIRVLARKVVWEADGGLEGLQGHLEVEAGKGTVWRTALPEHPRGHPSNPMSEDALEAKFRSCAGHAARPPAESQLNEIVGLMSRLEHVPDVGREISGLLA